MLIFGHDFIGDYYVFNLDNNYSIVELLHETQEIYETGMSFKEYIEAQLRMGKDGWEYRRTDAKEG